MKTQALNADSHIFLYAKRWYKRTEVFADLKKIISVRNGCEAQYISDGDVITLLCELVFPFITDAHKFQDFVLSFFRYKGKNYSGAKIMITPKEIVISLLSVLELVKVKDSSGNIVRDIIQLDEPDYSILPKQDE